MRDDIHKSAPVNKLWKSVLKHCNRESDRKERAAESALKAVAADCSRELSPGFVNDLIDRCKSPKADLFRGNFEGVHATEDGGHVLEQQLVERLQVRAQSGSIDLNGLRDELAGVIEGRKESQARAIRGHVLKAGGKGAAVCNEALKNCLTQVSAVDCANQILANGGKMVVPAKRAKKVSIDENLLS
jgi:hypothetical protein